MVFLGNGERGIEVKNWTVVNGDKNGWSWLDYISNVRKDLPIFKKRVNKYNILKNRIFYLY